MHGTLFFKKRGTALTDMNNKTRVDRKCAVYYLFLLTVSICTVPRFLKVHPHKPAQLGAFLGVLLQRAHILTTDEGVPDMSTLGQLLFLVYINNFPTASLTHKSFFTRTIPPY